MGYIVAIILGVIILIMGALGVLGQIAGAEPPGGPDVPSWGPLIPLAIGAALIGIGIMGLRRRNTF